MNDLDTNQQIDVIKEHVIKIDRRIGGSGMALWRGILTGFGYIIGAFIAILIIGWALNVVGIIPSFKQQVTSLKDALQQAQERQIPAKK